MSFSHKYQDIWPFLSRSWSACLNYLLLKCKDVSNTAIDWISKPSLCLITYCDHRIESLMHRYMQKKFGHVACPKHFVHSCEMTSPLLWIKVWRKYTPWHTLPPQKLASPTWPSTTTTTTTATTASTTATATTTSRVYTLLYLYFVGFFSLSLLSSYKFLVLYDDDDYHIIGFVG